MLVVGLHCIYSTAGTYTLRLLPTLLNGLEVNHVCGVSHDRSAIICRSIDRSWKNRKKINIFVVIVVAVSLALSVNCGTLDCAAIA